MICKKNLPLENYFNIFFLNLVNVFYILCYTLLGLPKKFYKIYFLGNLFVQISDSLSVLER